MEARKRFFSLLFPELYRKDLIEVGLSKSAHLIKLYNPAYNKIL